MEENMYVSVRETLASKPKLIPVTEKLEQIIKNTNKDYYVSLYQYTEAHKKLLEEKGTLAGVTDTTTNRLYFDFDDKDVPENARQDAITLANRLIEKGFNEDNIDVNFTGNKGFSVELTVDKQITPNQFSAIVDNLAGDLKTFDAVVKDPNRIVRVQNTKHQKSGLYKIPLTPEELIELSIDDIKALAVSPRTVDRTITKAKLPEGLMELKVKEAKIQEIKRDLSFDTSTIDMTQKPRGMDEARWLLSNGFFRSGERNPAFLCLAATYKNFGYPQEVTKGILEGVANLQATRTGEDNFPEKEMELILKQVYGPNWKGGMFSVKDPSNWLYKYAVKMGINIHEEVGPRTLMDIEGDFTSFIRDIEKNTLKTGLAKLDHVMPITVGSNIGVVAAAGAGKCLGKDTPILMYDGSIKMVQDVLPNELVMGDDSTPRRVLGITKGREKLYKVKQSYGDDYIVNASHIISVKTNQNKGKYQKGNVIDINVEDYINSSKDFKRLFRGYKVGADFGNREVLVDAYYLGLWLGDGDSASPEITNIDPEIKDYLKSYCDKLGMKYREVKHPNRTETLTLTKLSHDGGKSKKSKLQELMDMYNLFGNKHIPEDYLKTTRENRLQLLAGLLDSDGYLDQRNNKAYFEISQKNKSLSEQIVFLVRSLGLKATLNEVRKGCHYKGEYKEGTYYQVYIKGSDLSEIPTKVARKKATVKQPTKNYLSSTLEIEDIGEGDYYGFEVDGNHRFLLGDFTVTHNTAFALNVLKHNSQEGITTVFASLDMHKNRLFEKVLYNLTGISREELYTKFKNGEAKELLEMVRKHYGNVYFYDKASATVSDIKRYVQEVEAKTGQKVKMVLIDYFERVNSDVNDDTAASKKIAGEIQDMINELDIACITLCQPSKMSLGGGPDTELKSYTNIKGSSFLYQSFRGIISLSRPFYTPETKELDKYIVINVLKNDLGELDRLEYGWKGKRGEIHELEDIEREELKELMKMKNSNKKDQGWE